MKILFETSVTGRNEYEKNYQAIDQVLNRLGHEVISPVFITWRKDVEAETEQQANQYYKNLRKWIKEAEILVFEASYPSLGVGHEVTWGLQLGKPVIVLYVKGKKPFILEAFPSEKLQIIEYRLDNLERQLKDAVGYAADQQDTRFNFFISPKIGTYLDFIAKKKKLPRAVYLRKLIEEDMKSNKEYEKTS